MNATIEAEVRLGHAPVGITAAERLAGSCLHIRVAVQCPIGPAMISDRIEDTLDYGRLAALARQAASEPACLLEHVIARILEGLRAEFPPVRHARIHIQKRSPAGLPDVAQVGVEVVCSW